MRDSLYLLAIKWVDTGSQVDSVCVRAASSKRTRTRPAVECGTIGIHTGNPLHSQILDARQLVHRIATGSHEPGTFEYEA